MNELERWYALSPAFVVMYLAGLESRYTYLGKSPPTFVNEYGTRSSGLLPQQGTLSRLSPALIAEVRALLHDRPDAEVLALHPRLAPMIVALRRGYLERVLGDSWKPVMGPPVRVGSPSPSTGAVWRAYDRPSRHTLRELLRVRSMTPRSLAKAVGAKPGPFEAAPPGTVPPFWIDRVAAYFGIYPWHIWPKMYGWWIEPDTATSKAPPETVRTGRPFRFHQWSAKVASPRLPTGEK